VSTANTCILIQRSFCFTLERLEDIAEFENTRMLDAWVLGVSAIVGLIAGLMIGCIGVGGVILVPILTQLPVCRVLLRYLPVLN
jgi:hypothetical protein